MARAEKDSTGEAGAAEKTRPRPSPPLAFAEGCEFSERFRRCDAGEARGDYVYFIGTIGAEQLVVRARMRPLSPAGLYVDAQIVAGGGRLSGRQLLGLASLVARSTAGLYPCRVRTEEERYRAGRVRSEAQGLVPAKLDCALGDMECAEVAPAAVPAYASALCLGIYYAARGRTPLDRCALDEATGRLSTLALRCSKVSNAPGAQKRIKATFELLRRRAPPRRVEESEEGAQLRLVFAEAA